MAMIMASLCNAKDKRSQEQNRRSLGMSGKGGGGSKGGGKGGASVGKGGSKGGGKGGSGQGG
jgi:hypothetical protein